MKQKIILFNPRVSLDRYHNAPLGLLSIVSLLEKEKKYDIKIISASEEPNFKNKILKNMKDAICFGVGSMTGYQIKEGLEISKIIKQKFPNKPIIWGGFHPTILPEETIRNKNIDIVIKGQAQRTFSELIKKLEKKQSLKDIKGIFYKEKEKIIKTEDRHFEDINNFPQLPYHLINMELYIRPAELPKSKRLIDYISSQGCPFNCGFCAEILFSNRNWSGLTAKRVVDDLEMLSKTYNLDGFTIADNNFFVDKKRIKEICEEIIKRDLKFNWGNANGRIRLLANLEEEIWELLEKSGCKSILVGAESGSQKTLNLINKQATVEETIKLTKISKKYNIQVTFSLMTGLPPLKIKNAKKEVREDFNQTFKLLDNIFKIRNDNNILFYLYTPYPGNPLHNKCLEIGMKFPKSLEDWANFELENLNTFWVPKDVVNKVEQLREYIFPYMSNLYLERHTKKFQNLQKIVHQIVKLRWRYKFFSLPLDYILFKKFREKIHKSRKFK